MKFGKKEKVSENLETESNLLDSIKFGEKSLLVTSKNMKVYQMIDCGDKFLFLRLTKDKFSPTTDFENIPENQFSEIYNLVIEKSSIVSVDVTEFDPAKMTEVDLADYCIGADLNIKFKAENEDEQFVEKNFSIWYEVEAEQLEKFVSSMMSVTLTNLTLYFDIACICAIILTLLFCIFSKESKKISAAISYVIIVTIISFGSIRIVNCTFDLQQPTSTEMVVTDTKSTATEYMIFTPRVHKLPMFSNYVKCEDGNTYRTSSNDYEYIIDGDTVTVVKHSGLFGIPWAEVKADTSSKTRTEWYRELLEAYIEELLEEKD